MYEDSRRSLLNIRNLVALHSLHVMIILSPRISGDKADHVCRRIGFTDFFRVEDECTRTVEEQVTLPLSGMYVIYWFSIKQQC